MAAESSKGVCREEVSQAGAISPFVSWSWKIGSIAFAIFYWLGKLQTLPRFTDREHGGCHAAGKREVYMGETMFGKHHLPHRHSNFSWLLCPVMVIVTAGAVAASPAAILSLLAAGP